jgi:hypothetical protein
MSSTSAAYWSSCEITWTIFGLLIADASQEKLRLGMGEPHGWRRTATFDISTGGELSAVSLLLWSFQCGMSIFVESNHVNFCQNYRQSGKISVSDAHRQKHIFSGLALASNGGDDVSSS